MAHSDHSHTVCLVACTSRKSAYPSPAEFVYRSPLFSAARNYAESRCGQWFILSAKYELLSPHDTIEPYNKTLLTMAESERRTWAASVHSAIRQRVQNPCRVIFLSGLAYRQYLAPLLEADGFETAAPLSSLGIGSQVAWLQRVRSQANRLAHMDRLYDLLERLHESEKGRRRKLLEASSSSVTAQRGIYFFFEADEFRMTSPFQKRITRIGTHAVSAGSKSTLWGRLRTHRGGADGHGNHRGSIFRLHVGESLIRKSQLDHVFATWGHGQSAPARIREAEQEIELEVSAIVGSMEMTWLEVGDESSADSDRAYLERNLIALLSGSGGPLDLPSAKWLGRWSRREAIPFSGLWNVNHVYDSFDATSLDVLERYIEAAEGTGPPVRGPIAPSGWRAKIQAGGRQGQQFELL